MTEQQHIIKKQILDIRLHRQENAFQIQNQLSALYHSRILGVLDELCSTIAGPDQYIRFDTLQIDLGRISSAHLEEEFTEKVQKCLYEALSSQVNQIRLVSQSQKGTFKPPAKIRDSSGLPHSQVDNRIMSPNVFELELFQYVLETGTFPWWAEKLSSGTLEDTFLRVLKNAPHETKQILKQELSDENARHRLIYQFSDALLLHVVEVFAPEKTGQFQNWLNDFTTIYHQTQFVSIPTTEFRLFVWDALLAALLTYHHAELPERELVRTILSSFAQRQNATFRTIIQALQEAVEHVFQSQGVFHSPLPNVVAALSHDKPSPVHQPKECIQTDPEFPLKHEIRQNSAFPEQSSEDSVSTNSLRESTHPKLARSQTGGWEPTFQRSSSLKKPSDESAQFADESAVQEIYIENAGLVLLWPYLKTFFQHLGLLQERNFVDETSAMRAIHLLQYLVTGEQDTPEYFLTLNKLLCGWEISKPVSKEFKISDSEKVESEELLGSVITHWSALKNTSVEGFQTSFLKRNGILVKQEKSWIVRVERKAYDLLLERLPWSISIIKLSWMNTVVYVEW